MGNTQSNNEGGGKYLPDPNAGYIQVEIQEGGDPEGAYATFTDSSQAKDSPQRPLPGAPSKILVRALYNFEGIDKDDLPFRKGDVMELDESIPEADGWWLATHLKTKKKGFIPYNYVTKDDASPQAQDWWFEFDRKESDKMLLHPGNPQGTFLVREASDKSAYVLSVRDVDKATKEPCVKHYRILKRDDGAGFFTKSKKHFETLIDIVDHYKANEDGLCCRLSQACPRLKPVVPFKEFEIDREKVKLTSSLGAGNFGEVWKGTMHKVVDVAVKTIKQGNMSPEAFLQEAKIMHKLTHPKLVQLLAVVSVQEPFWIITELMVSGALLDYLRSEQGNKLTLESLISINAQIADGMRYLESVNFVHRDLRAANILVGENLDVKVADFGLTRILEENEDNVYLGSENTKFPVKWTAPEAAREKKFSVKSDVWSFGVLMYEVITFGKIPYPGCKGSEVLSMVENGYRMPKPTRGPIEVPDSYYEMMLKCWDEDPEQRPTFQGIYDFFDNFSVQKSSPDFDEGAVAES